MIYLACRTGYAAKRRPHGPHILSSSSQFYFIQEKHKLFSGEVQIMDMSTEIGILLAYALGIFALYVIGYMFLVPIKILLRLVINSIAGALAILVFNWIGAFIGLHISLNLLSAVIVGLLGVPGAIFLAGYHYFGL